jgi:hypothetical protein
MIRLTSRWRWLSAFHQKEQEYWPFKRPLPVQFRFCSPGKLRHNWRRNDWLSSTFWEESFHFLRTLPLIWIQRMIRVLRTGLWCTADKCIRHFSSSQVCRLDRWWGISREEVAPRFRNLIQWQCLPFIKIDSLEGRYMSVEPLWEKKMPC